MATDGLQSFEGNEPGRAARAGGRLPQSAEIEVDAERMLLALESVIVAELPGAADAERYASRLRFALARCEELRRESLEQGGAFAPARLEVSTWILENHVQAAAAYINRAVRRARRQPGRRTTHAEVDEAVNNLEEQRREEAA